MQKKAQSAIEFIIIVGFVLFFFIMFIGFMQSQALDKTYEKRNLILKNTLQSVQEEINLASTSVDGYYREFTLPQTILNLEYEINIIENIVYANTTNQKHAMALPIKNVTGTINPGTNIIEKENGTVYLNQWNQ